MSHNKVTIPSKEECLAILKKYNTPLNVIKHCILVADIAEEIISDISTVNKDLIVAGAMLHDIGRSKDHSIFHAVVGVEILSREKIDPRIISIVENHIGTGIDIEEAKKLKLPPKNYVPLTTEEIIVSYADNLACGEKKCSFEKTLVKFINKFGENSNVVKRFYKQLEHIQKIKGN